MAFVKIIFWLTFLLIFWTYFGYPLILRLLSYFRAPVKQPADFTPPVSLIITAYNEEKKIAEKLQNTLTLNYPREKLEVIVVSDGSTDRTEEIVRSFEDRGIRLLSIPERHGKHYGQGRGIKEAGSEIVVLSDATTFLEPDSVRMIVRSFADPQIGCVSGHDNIRAADEELPGEGFYVRYEMMLRSQESAFNSLVGVSGCFFAVRKHLCSDWIDNMSSDFYMPIVTYMNGMRTILDKRAVAYYEVLVEPEKEFIRKVRTIVHGLEVLGRFKSILNPFKYGVFALQMFSHKLSRWLVPLYLVLFFWANLLLIGRNNFYLVCMILQIAFYVMAFLGKISKHFEESPLFRIPLFFVMVNYSILVAWHYFLIGKEFVVWEPTER